MNPNEDIFNTQKILKLLKPVLPEGIVFMHLHNTLVIRMMRSCQLLHTKKWYPAAFTSSKS